MNKKFLGIICALAIISSCVLYGQNKVSTTKTTNDDGSTTTETTLDANDPANKVTVDEDGNVQAEMTVEFKDAEGAPYYAVRQPHNADNSSEAGEGNFREDVKDGEDATIHYIEDNSYKASENSLAYNDTGSTVGDTNKKLDGDPDINWEIKDEGSGNSDSDNNNKASKDCTFSDAGTYSVHNCGSRQLSEADGTDDKDDDTGIGGTDEEMASKKKDETTDEEKAKMTAMGTIPVKIHDVTPPDVWIAFQENDVDVDNLKSTMKSKMISGAGMPLDKDENSELFGRTSFIFVDEGNTYSKPEGYDEMSDEEKEEVENKIIEQTKIDGRRDMEYPFKSVRVTLAGNIFTKEGNSLSESDGKTIVNTIESNFKDLNRKADVDFTKKVPRHEAEKDLTDVDPANQGVLTWNEKGYGVFARQNVSLLPVVMYVDNGNKRKTVGVIKPSTDGNSQVEEENEEGEVQEAEQIQSSGSYYKVVTKDGTPVEPQEDGTYLFRVANYPRESFEDQPDYYFETEVNDKAKNTTFVRIPLYVVSTSANDEATSTK